MVGRIANGATKEENMLKNILTVFGFNLDIFKEEVKK